MDWVCGGLDRVLCLGFAEQGSDALVESTRSGREHVPLLAKSHVSKTTFHLSFFRATLNTADCSSRTDPAPRRVNPTISDAATKHESHPAELDVL